MRYFRILTFSLLIHLIFGIVISMIPQERLNLKHKTYVELLENPQLTRHPHQQPRDTKQFTRQVDVPENFKTKQKKEAKFASEEERYVLEEQRARLNDMTKNRSAESKSQATPSNPSTRASVKKEIDFKPKSSLQHIREIAAIDAASDIYSKPNTKSEQEPDSQEPNKKQRPALNLRFTGAEAGVSSFGETAPDHIRFGDFTALNTDRHLFYSFYARMEEKIRYRWVNYARAAAYNISSSQIKSSGKEAWVTKLEVILDEKGNYIRAILHESSGSKGLDAAPVQAFKEAGQFPNPPSEMIKEDGAIHVYYVFNVNLSPGLLAGN